MQRDSHAAPLLEAEPEPRPPFRLEVLTARELCELPDPPGVDRLLGPIVRRRARTIIVASTGNGKTTFATEIVAAIVDRREFLGWHGAGGRALILDLEQGLRTVKRRLAEAGLADSDAVDYVRVPDGLRLDQDAAHRHALEQILDERAIDVLLVDPYYKAHALADSNEERATVELMRLLDGWRERYGFALVLPTHTRKRGQDAQRFTIDDAFGSSALTRGAEIVLGLDLVRPGYSRLHFFKDRDGDDDLPVRGDPWGLLFDRDNGYRRDPADTEPPRDLERELLDLAADGAWRTLKEWRAPKGKGGIGANEDTVRATLARLVTAGELEYAIGPHGRGTTAQCWRLPGATLLPRHPVAPEAHEPLGEGTASVPPPPIGGTRRQGTPPRLPRGTHHHEVDLA